MTIEAAQKQMEKAISSLESNLRTLRTGRANSSILESIKVDVYGTNLLLNQISTINIVDFKTITIQPWDQNNLDPINKAINNANLGFMGNKEADLIRISVPDLTEERRKELVKVVGTYEEEAKISLRHVRKDFIDKIKADKDSTEDDIRLFTEDIDKLIKKFNEKASILCNEKTADMMKV